MGTKLSAEERRRRAVSEKVGFCDMFSLLSFLGFAVVFIIFL